ncbi:hypothetical protein vBEcoMWL3_gp090 [Escherichia phage vB_EcoM_WL-3]|nr:hypothetical protein vBEcoMWL3_gp090 [Escherichia phage vB_EcoM_WL-3]
MSINHDFHFFLCESCTSFTRRILIVRNCISVFFN